MDESQPRFGMDRVHLDSAKTLTRRVLNRSRSGGEVNFEGRAYAFAVIMELLGGRLVPFVPLCGQFLRSVRENMAAKRRKKYKNDQPHALANLNA